MSARAEGLFKNKVATLPIGMQSLGEPLVLRLRSEASCRKNEAWHLGFRLRKWTPSLESTIVCKKVCEARRYHDQF